MNPNSNLYGFDDESTKIEISSRNNDSKSSSFVHVLEFHKKHVFSTKNNPICGITFYQWYHILFHYGKFIEIIYFPRVIFITLLSLMNSFLAMIESIYYPESYINSIQLPIDPVFIIGHPRTGTTLVHNLLSLDQSNFYYCTTFCAGFPNSFLWFESIGKYLFSSIIEKTRPMDSMPLHFDLPQEDEIATNIISKGKSYYMPLWFMSQEQMFRKYLDFNSIDGGTKEDEDIWIQSFIYLLKKLTIRHNLLLNNNNSNNNNRYNHKLLIKSPIHTARIPILKKLFPKAKFIYIHRDPYQILQSSAHMADTAYWFCYLNTPNNEKITEFIFWQFENMWKKYNNAVLLNKNEDNNNNNNRLIDSDVLEISYNDLILYPLDILKSIYSHINILWNKDIQYQYEKELYSLQSSYKVNVHSTLSNEIKDIVRSRWSDYMEAFGYK